MGTRTSRSTEGARHTADTVDPQIRLQNIALEHAELSARRSMCWGEATNRTTMFLTVVGAGVVGLALFAQTGAASNCLALLALLILSVVTVIGLTTFVRVTQLDDEDMRLVQGLNRLRHARLELDPGLAPFLVTSPHDDFESVLQAYGSTDASWTSGFATLAVLTLIINCVLVGVIGGLIAVNVGIGGAWGVIVGLVAAVAFAVGLTIWFFRKVARYAARFVALVPAPRATDERPSTVAGGPSDRTALDDDRPPNP